MSKWKRRFILLEIGICWGATLLTLPFMLMALPYHLWLLVNSGYDRVVASVILYDLCATAGVVAVWAAYNRAFGSGTPTFASWIVKLGLAAACVGLLLTPVGVIVTRFLEPLDLQNILILLFFAVLPLACLVHLTCLDHWMSQRHVHE